MRYTRESAAISNAEPNPGPAAAVGRSSPPIAAETLQFAYRRGLLYWIRRYIRANGLRHPQEMGVAEVEHFLSDLRGASGQLPARRTRHSRPCCSVPKSLDAEWRT